MPLIFRVATYSDTFLFDRIVSSMIYYAISIYSSDFSSDRFINVLLAGATEFPAILMGYLMVKYIGRPRTSLLLMVLCAFSSVLLPFIPDGKLVVPTQGAVNIVDK